MANLTVSEFKRKASAKRAAQLGVAAALLLSSSPIALHAETSNTELAKEIAELKAQIRELRGSVVQTRREVKAKRVVAPVYAAAPAYAAALPEGATPVFVTADKKMQYGSLTITPGGFIAMESGSRTRSEQTDFQSNFSGIPNNNSPNAHEAESRFSARQSRAALLIESPISSSMLVSGYGEFDFLAAGATSNMNQTYSYVPRIRHLYATLDNSDYGMHVLAGQEWSLVTMNSKGITPRNEVTPPQIDPSYIPGFAYARTPQIRLTKDFNKKLWLSVSAEASQTTGAGCLNGFNAAAGAAVAATGGIPANNVLNTTCLTAANGPSLSGVTQNISYNKIPDVIGKVAYEAKLADRDIHLEALALYRNFESNTLYNPAAVTAVTGAAGFPIASNQSANGFGVGGGIIAPIIPKRLDFQASGLVGRGIARYMSSGGFTDVAETANGGLKAVPAVMALIGATLHVTPSIDLYAFGGFEQEYRTYSQVGVGAAAQFVGYGAPAGFNNAGCQIEGGTCTGQQRRVFQLTGGFWDKLYKGSFGEVRVGVQYSYTQRELFGATSAANGIITAAAPYTSARANDQAVFTSFRYYPFQ